MAEPIVGMKYGTYDTLSLQNRKYYKQQNGYHDVVRFGTGSLKIWHDLWVDQNDRKRFVIGSKTLDDGSYNMPYNKACLDVLYKSDSGEISIMQHTGKERIDDDIKFNAIYGEKTYAVDHNENGVVDEGEIKPYNTIA